MAFKGTPNRQGRTKGTLNKSTSEVRESFSLLLSNNLERIQKDLDSLEPFQRVKVLLELSSFIIPKLKQTELTTDQESKGFQPIQINFIDKNEIAEHVKNLNEKY
jgi:hypothetical protein